MVHANIWKETNQVNILVEYITGVGIKRLLAIDMDKLKAVLLMNVGWVDTF